MSTLDDLVNAATTHHGTHRGFSQSHPNVKRLRSVPGMFTNDKEGKSDSDQLYVGGMCHTMSMYWIAHQANGGGKSFWDWLKPTGNFDEAAINVLVTKTVMYKSGGGQAKQGIRRGNDFDESFFLRWGLKRADTRKEGYGQIVRNMCSSSTIYYMLGHEREGGGHECALHAKGFYGGAIYYDPNYGDFEFNDYMDAMSWYYEYLRITDYQNKYPKVTVDGFRHA